MVRLGRPRCLLVVAPHPDDETIGGFGLMARCRQRGIPVRVLVASDGSGSHPASTAWPRHRLVAERRRETLRALRRSGLPKTAVMFLGLPDGGLDGVSRSLAAAIGLAARRAPKPLLIAAPLAEDDHADHRAVAAAVAAIRGHGVRVCGFPIWPVGARTLSRGRAIILSGRERMAKRHLIRSYRTQAGGITDDPSGFTMTWRHIAAFSRPFEQYVEVRR